MVEEERAEQAQQPPPAEPGLEPDTAPEPELTEAQRKQRNLRVSDAEREHVVELLKRAIGRGMLDLDEFTERTDTALAARTRGELNAVLVDLPGLVHQDALTSVTASAMSSASPGPGAASTPGVPPSADRLELKAHGSSLNRGGRWYVPAEVLVRNKYGHTTLDFTEAEVATSVVRLELDTKWGSVTMVIPEEAAVDVNGITEVKWGNLDDKTRSNGRTGTPRYVVTGRVHGGSLTIKNPRRGLFSR
ncbi:DUF1707 SHOCT-like domain-containing protein [Amycolatopsis cihanbeyliensis]|uniref:Uncharacterized protein DUF1707 n=1 Tax=Amycolatopsis cihanbeyliensis TaxID=1128664 RepID=A0A542DL66_AMYCI|nr:DUF1707 domain-containing protein [Amycolatopsis cihanbeyliensis]TQJ03829.1 uncharacterized protein DUF1707 [Amycolatopsis cihanbeyliensis]